MILEELKSLDPSLQSGRGKWGKVGKFQLELEVLYNYTIRIVVFAKGSQKKVDIQPLEEEKVSEPVKKKRKSSAPTKKEVKKRSSDQVTQKPEKKPKTDPTTINLAKTQAWQQSPPASLAELPPPANCDTLDEQGIRSLGKATRADDAVLKVIVEGIEKHQIKEVLPVSKLFSQAWTMFCFKKGKTVSLLDVRKRMGKHILRGIAVLAKREENPEILRSQTLQSFFFYTSVRNDVFVSAQGYTILASFLGRGVTSPQVEKRLKAGLSNTSLGILELLIHQLILGELFSLDLDILANFRPVLHYAINLDIETPWFVGHVRNEREIEGFLPYVSSAVERGKPLRSVCHCFEDGGGWWLSLISEKRQGSLIAAVHCNF